MYCPKCGKENDDSAQFCSSCGNKLNVAPEAKQAPAMGTTATGAVTVGDGSTAAAAHKTGRILVIIGVVVVLVLAIGAFATGGFGLMDFQPKSTVDIGASSQGGNEGQILADNQGEEGLVKSGVDAYSWEELSRISSEIASAEDEAGAIEVAKKYNLTTPEGELDGYQRKDFQLTNGANVQAQIAGFWHDDKTDGGKAGITFIFMDAIARRGMNSSDTNSGGWEKSEMRTWLASDGMDMLPDDLRDRIIAVDKSTNNVGITDSLGSVTVTSDKLWLFSVGELCGEVGRLSLEKRAQQILDSEGSQYGLFREMRVTDNGQNDILVRRFDNECCNWWARTPWPFSGEPDRYNFSYVDIHGNIGTFFESVMTAEGVVPGFCI